MPTSLHRALCVAALAALPLAACGDDNDPAANGGGGGEPTGGAIEVTTNALDFDPNEVTAPAGTIDFVLVNGGSQPHTLVVEGHEREMKLTVGNVDEGSIDLEAGDYVFYCDVPGHRGGGMEGTLTVTE